MQLGEGLVDFVAQLGVEHPLGGVHHGLAGGVHHRGAAQVVVVDGGQVVAGRVVPVDLVIHLPVDACLDALGRHAAHVGQRVERTDDGRPLLNGEQTIVETHVVGGHHAFQVIHAEAIAHLDAGGGFRLDRVLDRIEACLGGRERRSAGGRADQCTHVLGGSAEQFTVGIQVVHEADLGQEALVGVDLACLVVAHEGAGLDVHLHALEAELQTQGVRGLPDVLHVQLRGLGVEGVFPLGQQRVALELEEVAAREGGAGLAIEAAGLLEVVVFQPEAGAQCVRTRLVAQLTDEAGSVDLVFRGADGQRRATRGRHIRGAPQALALVVVEVGRGIQCERLVHRQIELHVGQIVLAQAGRVPVGVIQAVHRPGEGATGGSDGAGVIGEVVVPVAAQTTDHVLGHVLIVVLGAVGAAVERRQHALSDGLHQFQVHIVLILFAGALPLVGILGGRAQEEARAGG